MKNLLYTLLLIGSVGFAQQTPESCLEKAKPYLAKDACNGTGIAWVKGALKLDPDNAEAGRLIDACDRVKLDKAQNLLQQDPASYEAKNLLSDLLEKDENNEQLNYLLAKVYMEQTGANAKSERLISKALESSPTKLEYLWMRVSCNLNGNKNQESFKTAIADLNKIIAIEPGNAKALANLSIANRELANELFYGDNKAESLKYYLASKKTGEEALKKDQSYKDDLRLSDIDKALADLEQS